MEKQYRRNGLSLVLIAVALLMAACSPTLEFVPSPRQAPVSVATVVPQQHDIAIVAVDFDPSLDLAQIRSNGGVSLLVAVENKGLADEAEIRLTAQLLDPGADMRELSSESIIVGELRSHTLRVVRFTPVFDLPHRDRYQLVVTLSPIAGETETSNNTPRYDIVVRNNPK